MGDTDDISPSDAMQIGWKITEMADRALAAKHTVPNAEMKWKFEMGDETFLVVVSVVHSEPERAPHMGRKSDGHRT